MYISDENALMFLFRHPDIHKRCIESAGNYSHSGSEQDKAIMQKEWEAAKELYMTEKQERLDRLWEECLGVAVS